MPLDGDFPPKMMDNQKDVTAATLKKPKIVFTPKNRMREAANAAEVSVDNPARKKEPHPQPLSKRRGGVKKKEDQ